MNAKKGFAENVILTAYGLPEGFKAAAVTIDKAKKEGTVVIEGPASPKDFRQSLQIVGTAVIKKVTVQGRSLIDIALASGKAKSVADRSPPPKRSRRKGCRRRSRRRRKVRSERRVRKPAATPRKPTKVEP